jgi:hypothetical protein
MKELKWGLYTFKFEVFSNTIKITLLSNVPRKHIVSDFFDSIDDFKYNHNGYKDAIGKNIDGFIENLYLLLY